MREIRPYGSVRGARGDARPYRDSRGATEKSYTTWATVLASLGVDHKLIRNSGGTEYIDF